MTVKGLRVNSLNMSDDVPGMVLLNTTTFSGVTSVSLPTDTFTSTYTNYRVMLGEVYGAAGGNGLSFRMRKAGVDNTTASSYVRRGAFASNSSLALTTGTDTSFVLSVVNASATVPTSGFLDVFQPRLNNQTNFVTSFYDANGEQSFFNNGRHTVVDSFDSMTFLSGTNITGTVSVYGYNK
jgi:hypothetical protein